MRKKEDWMKRGCVVLACGEKGRITSFAKNKLSGVDYVYHISVKLIGSKRVNRYHPDDVLPC